MEIPEFPILGTEPLSVEFANTIYGSGAARTDYFQTPELIALWFAEMVGSDAGAPLPPPVDQQVRALRDAVRELLYAVADGRMPQAGAVEIVNEFSGRAPSFPVLTWSAGERPTTHRQFATTGVDEILARIATECVELIAGSDTVTVRPCPAPDCTMLFVKNHSRRRWCHPSCGHRDRQARYYRRHHPTEATR
ncbi:CGNR zinc finger domain-containing protein [Nocardia sp. NPDC058518]|uniref:CGNR zinc finger domain-containing protein n=1 Tax=Nocardia sp. NPDC058518 TaxID=3346534 RepID=UPI003665B500